MKNGFVNRYCDCRSGDANHMPFSNVGSGISVWTDRRSVQRHWLAHRSPCTWRNALFLFRLITSLDPGSGVADPTCDNLFAMNAPDTHPLPSRE
jgi:hypothetical protein